MSVVAAPAVAVVADKLVEPDMAVARVATVEAPSAVGTDLQGTAGSDSAEGACPDKGLDVEHTAEPEQDSPGPDSLPADMERVGLDIQAVERRKDMERNTEQDRLEAETAGRHKVVAVLPAAESPVFGVNCPVPPASVNWPAWSPTRLDCLWVVFAPVRFLSANLAESDWQEYSPSRTSARRPVRLRRRAG